MEELGYTADDFPVAHVADHEDGAFIWVEVTDVFLTFDGDEFFEFLV